MQIHGIEGMSTDQLRSEVRAGGRFVIFTFCVSLVLVTFKRGTDVYFIRAGESAAAKSLPWTLLSFALGWWGFPFGLVYTPMCIIQNLSGGKDVTAAVVGALSLEGGSPPPPPPALPPAALSGTPPPQQVGFAGGPLAGMGQLPGEPGAAPPPVSGWVAPMGAPVAPLGPPKKADAASSQATASLVLGVVGLCCAPLGWVGAILGVLAIRKAREAGQATPALAVVGLVLSGASTLLLLVAVVIGVVDSRERAARTETLRAEIAQPRRSEDLSRATACSLVELALLDGVYDSKSNVKHVTCTDEPEEDGDDFQVLSDVTVEWASETETLGACLTRDGARWYVLAVAPHVTCPDQPPTSTLTSTSTDLQAETEEKAARAAATPQPKGKAGSGKTVRPDSIGTKGQPQVQVPLGGGDDAQPHLELALASNIRVKQKPTSTPPFSTAGGDWTVFDVSVVGQPGAKATVGVLIKDSDQSFSFGDAFIATDDRASGAKFVAAFAKAFEVEAPKPSAHPQPLQPMTLHTAVLGQNLGRSGGGGFGDKGSWTATKWFLSADGVEAEVFFNYDLVSGRAELSQKDADYDVDAAALLAVALRDGPPPPRTPQTDPTLATSGPKFDGFKKVAEARTRSWLDPHRLLFATNARGHGQTVLMARELDSGATSELARFEGRIGQLETDGPRVLVQEVVSVDAETQSSADPANLWLIDGKASKATKLPSTAERPELLSASMSPDGRYLAVGVWENNASGSGKHRVVSFFDREKTVWWRISNHDTLDVVGWRVEKGELVAELQTGLRFDGQDNHQALDYFVVGRRQVPSTRPAQANPDVHLTSPDGRTRLEVDEGKALELLDSKSGQRRRLDLYPADRRFAVEDAFSFVSDSYLRFDAARPALIDARTLKVWFPLPATEEATLEYSDDFTTVVKTSSDGVFLGKVVTAKDPQRGGRPVKTK